MFATDRLTDEENEESNQLDLLTIFCCFDELGRTIEAPLR